MGIAHRRRACGARRDREAGLRRRPIGCPPSGARCRASSLRQAPRPRGRRPPRAPPAIHCLGSELRDDRAARDGHRSRWEGSQHPRTDLARGEPPIPRRLNRPRGPAPACATPHTPGSGEVCGVVHAGHGLRHAPLRAGGGVRPDPRGSCRAPYTPLRRTTCEVPCRSRRLPTGRSLRVCLRAAGWPRTRSSPPRFSQEVVTLHSPIRETG